MKILITGKNGYIGNAFQQYVQQERPDWSIGFISVRDGNWKETCDFSNYDVVLHAAGKAHADIGKVSDATIDEYYHVNHDLTVAVADHAKEIGVSQFIYLSSIIIYGESAPYGKIKKVDSTTQPLPTNFYGDSKWQADKSVRSIDTEKFRVAVVRPPMIYGYGSKGNYPLLAKIATKVPVFPNIVNQRSMLYIENLCEFLIQIIENKESGIFFPQNSEYVTTAEMVRQIAEAHGKKIRITKIINPFIWIVGKIPGKISSLVNKAFGNLIYDRQLSRYGENTYQRYNLRESVERTETKGRR